MTEERKLVTVLFADIVGSTEIGLEHDPEVVRATLARTFEAVRGVLVAHGGTVEKFIGDAVMAVFGVPGAHEDDADRAVRAAFALREHAAALGGRLPLAVRVGLNTGEAVAGSAASAQLLVTGTPVIAAGRLQTAAGPGEILVGALTHTLTRDGVRYGPRRDVPAKGFGTLEAWPALELASALPEAHRGLGPLRAPLIGRDRELRLLREAFERVGAEGTPSLVTIFGAAGVGKSRLVSELVARLRPARARTGRSLPYGEGITFYPLLQIVREECAIGPSDDKATALAKLGRTAGEVFDDPAEAQAIAARVAVAVGLVPLREALPGLADEAVVEELRYGLRRFLERRARRDPLVLIFEDFQWAEAALVELVEHLAEWSRAPLFLLCLARPDFRDAHAHFGAEAANASALTLAPLGPADTRQLVAELLAIEALPESLRAEVVQRAEGNPLYVEEFLRTLIETGRIVQRDGKWVATADLDHLEVPPSLVGLVSARLDRVSPEVKHILQRASIVGRVVSVAGLEAIGGAPVAPALLREAVRRDLLAETDERALGAGQAYRFKHPLTRDVAYGTVPKVERVQLHDRYGRWLETTLGDRREEAAELIAFHAEQAYLVSRELGEADAQDHGARALALLVAATDGAREPFDQRAAWKLYERAAAIAEAIGADPGLRAHTRGFAILGRYLFEPPDDSSDRALGDAIALARTAGPSPVLVRLLLRQARDALNRKDDPESAKRIAAELPELARATGDPDLLSETLVECGVLAYWWNDLASEERFNLDAVEAGRRASPLALRRALFRVRHTVRFTGDYRRAATYEHELARVPVGTSLFERRRTEAWAFEWAYDRGDFAAALDHGGKALAMTRELGVLNLIALDEWRVGEVLLAAGGQDARARELLEHGAATYERLQFRGQIPELRARAALACLRLGDREAARVHATAARSALLPLDVESQRITVQAEAQLQAAEGDSAAAVRALRDECARIEPLGHGWDLAQLRIALGEILLTAGRPADARAELSKARAFFHDPLARGWQEHIDGIIQRCDPPVR